MQVGSNQFFAQGANHKAASLQTLQKSSRSRVSSGQNNAGVPTARRSAPPTKSEPVPPATQTRTRRVTANPVGTQEPPSPPVSTNPPSTGPQHVRGDINGDGELNMSDAKALLSYLFSGGQPPSNMRSADLDGNGQIGIADVTQLLQEL